MALKYRSTTNHLVLAATKLGSIDSNETILEDTNNVINLR